MLITLTFGDVAFLKRYEKNHFRLGEQLNISWPYVESS
jgi:hypothetical protein